MQNNNSNDVSHFDLTVNAIKNEKSVKKKLNFFVKSIPVFFWQSKIAFEILGPLGFIGFLKLSEIYRLRDKEAKTMQEYNCYSTLKSFIEKLELSESEYAPFITVTQNKNMKTKRKIIERSSSSLNTLHRLLDDNKNTKVKLSDFSGSSKYDIVSGLYNLITDGIIENIRELKKYCDKDLDPMLVYVSLILAQGTMNLNKNVLDSGNKDAKIRLSDIGILTESQMDDCLYNLIDNNLIDGFDKEKYFDKDLNHMFGLSLFKSLIEPDRYPKLSELKSREKDKNMKLNTFFTLFKYFFKSRGRGENKNNKIKQFELQNLSGHQIAGTVYDLIRNGVIEDFDTLRFSFNLSQKSILRPMIGEVFLKLLFYHLDCCLKSGEHASNSEIASKFNINIKVVRHFFERYINHFTGAAVSNFEPSLDEFRINLFVNEFINSTGGFESLDPNYVMKHIVLDFRSKGSLSENEKIVYLKLLDKVTPSDSGIFKFSGWNSNSVAKLFMFLCITGAWGFYMNSGSEEFLKSLKLEQYQIENAFIGVLKQHGSEKRRESANFRYLYNALIGCPNDPSCSNFPRFLKMLPNHNSIFFKALTGSGIELLKPVLCAIMRSTDLESMERMLSKCLGNPNSIYYEDSLKACINNINKIYDCEKVRAILALIKVRRIFGAEETIVRVICDENDNKKINNDLKKIFDKAFKTYINSDDVNSYELSQIIKYTPIINLSDDQLNLVIKKAMETMDLHDMEKMFNIFLSYWDSACFIKGIKICIDNINELDDCKKIMSVIALIDLRHKLSNEFWKTNIPAQIECETAMVDFMYDKVKFCGTKISDEIKKVFNKAFENYIKSDLVANYEINKIIDYREIIGLNSTQLTAIYEKVFSLDGYEEYFINLLIDAIKRTRDDELKTEEKAILDEKEMFEPKPSSVLLDEEKEEKCESNKNVDNRDTKKGKKESLVTKVESIFDGIGTNENRPGPDLDTFLNKKRAVPKDNDKNNEDTKEDKKESLIAKVESIFGGVGANENKQGLDLNNFLNKKRAMPKSDDKNKKNNEKDDMK